MSLQVPAPGFVTIAVDEDLQVTVQLANAGAKSAEGGAAILSGGYGGWAEIARPRAKALVEWQGHQCMQLAVPIMFDGWTDSYGITPWGTSVEVDIRTLESMCHKDEKMAQPPVLQLLSNAIPGTGKKWVLNEIEWAADDIRRPTDGQRVRATATLIFLEWVDETLITSNTSSAQKRGSSKSSKNIKTKSKKGTYVVKEGDTIKKIAARVYGTSSKWKDIAKINKIRDGKALKVGQRLKMP
jgi:nucleoid-associated protein YgaU